MFAIYHEIVNCTNSATKQYTKTFYDGRKFPETSLSLLSSNPCIENNNLKADINKSQCMADSDDETGPTVTQCTCFPSMDESHSQLPF